MGFFANYRKESLVSINSLTGCIMQLNNDTLLKIHNQINDPDVVFKQASWDGCIYNKIVGATSYTEASEATGDSLDLVRNTISAWDTLNTPNPTNTLRQIIAKELERRGYLIEAMCYSDMKKSRVVNQTKSVVFESTLVIPDDLLSKEEVRGIIFSAAQVNE